ncbi:MAG: DUF2061 domain-containing protein [Bacteroidales bacterium]
MLDVLVNNRRGERAVKTVKPGNYQEGDRHIKSIFKAISWRIVGTLDTILISYLLTGKIQVALSIGSVEVFSKMFLYYLHERVWNAVRWGRMRVFIRNRTSFRKKRNLKRRISNFARKQLADAI